MKEYISASAFIILLTLSCGESKVQESIDPCEGVSCSGYGVCVVNDDRPSCICKEGYESVKLKCVKIDSGNLSDTDLNIMDAAEDDGLYDRDGEEDASSMGDVEFVEDISHDLLIDSGKGCQDKCNEPGARLCESKITWKICGDFDADGCYEWGDPNSCPSNSECEDGICHCGSDFYDCNGYSYDGCESNINEDVNNCGRCNNTCIVNNALSECVERRCFIKSCNPGWGDCDRKYETGCESNLFYDSSNCGGCGNICGNESYCDFGLCKCNYGFADCNSSQGDGCEVRLLSDNNNCGNCGRRCGLHSVCISGTCACDTNWGDCNSISSDGCETDLTQDNNNCGMCNNKCGQNAYCNQGLCKCNSGWGDCNQDWYDGCERALMNDNNNCGKCNFSCGQNASCSQMTCKCNYGYDNCNGIWSDGCEIDVLHDNNNCGKCLFQCGYKAWCQNGKCTCEWPFGNCNDTWFDGCEVDTSTTKIHCGMCWKDCGPNTYCENSQCRCVGWYRDCDAYAGCETETGFNNFNCGSCNNVCPPDKYCSYGRCVN